MTITSLQPIFTGVNSTPRWVALTTDDSYATITTAGYLNNSITTGFSFNPSDMVCAAYGSLSAPTLGFFNTNISAGVVTLVPIAREGEVTLPTIANHVIVSTDTVGTLANLVGTAINDGSLQAGRNTIAGSLISYPATTTTGFFAITAIANAGAFNTILSNASLAQTTTFSLPDPGSATANIILSKNAGTQHITTGVLQVDAGALISGLSTGGFVGKLQLFPTTTTSGSLTLQATANIGNTTTIITNASMGQASTLSIPDPGASTANFLLSTGTANIITDFQQIIGINEILIASVGTWTRTRIAQGNYVLRHTAADDTSVIGIDITKAIRTAVNKGFRLASIDIIYSIGTAALDAHTLTLDQIAYGNTAPVDVTSVPLTGSLSIATNANPYLTNIAVTTPAFLVTVPGNGKYVLELTVNAAATSAYDFYGINLRFSQTIA